MDRVKKHPKKEQTNFYQLPLELVGKEKEVVQKHFKQCQK